MEIGKKTFVQPLIYTFFFLYFLLNNTFSLAQNTFNRYYDFGFKAMVITNILPTDSCIYTCAIAVDSIYPYRTVNLFVKFDLKGNPLIHKVIRNKNIEYETWSDNLTFTLDNNLVANIYSIDSSSLQTLIKYNTQGDSLWLKRFPLHFTNSPDKFDRAEDLIALPDSGFLLLGQSTENINNYGHEKLTLTRIDKLGNILWKKAYGGPISLKRRSTPQKMIKYREGYLLYGNVDNVSSYKNFKMHDYLVYVDTLGNKIWDWITDPNENYGTWGGVVAEEDGSIIVASYYGKQYEINLSINGIRGYQLLYKLDSSRNMLWQCPIRNKFAASDNVFNKLLRLKDGSGYVAAGDGFHQAKIWEGVLSKVSPAGDSVWTRYYHVLGDFETEGDMFYTVDESPDGGFIMSGDVSGDFKDSIKGVIQRGWLIKVDKYGCLIPGCYIASEEIKTDSPQVMLYPNPSNEMLGIYISSAAPLPAAQLRVLDMSGRQVSEYKIAPSDTTYLLPTYNLTNGTYLLQVLSEGKLLRIEKFVVVH